MKKIVTENGFVSLYGKETLDAHLGQNLNSLLDNYKSESELLMLKAVLSKYIGDKISEQIHNRQEIKNNIQEMSDREFLRFVCQRRNYNEFSKEELERIAKITNKIKEDLKKAKM